MNTININELKLTAAQINITNCLEQEFETFAEQAQVGTTCRFDNTLYLKVIDPATEEAEIVEVSED